MSKLTKAAGAVFACSVLYPFFDGCWRGAYTLSYQADLLFHLKAASVAAAGLFVLVAALGHATSHPNANRLV